jgi:hypothetical protein
MMKTRKYSIFLAVIFVIVATLACNALSPKPTVSNLRMATDESGNTTTSSYAPADAFYVFADLSGLKLGSVVEAKWYAVNATGVDANSEINTSDYTYESGIDYVYFQLTTNDGSDWPVGSYKVELYLDGTKTGELDFNVQ